jgi:hypothetical protein
MHDINAPLLPKNTIYLGALPSSIHSYDVLLKALIISLRFALYS